MSIRGIEHIGITVTNLDEAEKFFVNALGASVLYRIVPPDEPDKSLKGKDMFSKDGFPAEINISGLAMLRLANGCNVELFQTQPEAKEYQANPSQPGINHFSLYVDNIKEVGESMKNHGAKMFEGPTDCFAQEEGKGNQTWFGMTPFGVLIELITLPSALKYDDIASSTRWIPRSTEGS